MPRPDGDQSGDAQRPMHPALKTTLAFVFGALFGAVAVFFYVTQRIPAALPTAAPAQLPATTAAQPDPAPPAAAIAPSPAPLPDAQPPPTTPALDEPSSASGEPPTTTPTDQPTAALMIPVAGIQPGQLTDTFTQARSGGRVHDAIDIMAPRGSQVLATDDGKVVKLFNSKLGGITLYQFDPTEKFVYYYAHLDGYAPGVIEGKQLHRGDMIGYVGSTGDANAAAPHLHFEISVLGPEKHWWQATALNPYPLLTRH